MKGMSFHIKKGQIIKIINEKTLKSWQVTVKEQNTQEEKTVSSVSGTEKTGELHAKMKLEHSLIPCTKIN